MIITCQKCQSKIGETAEIQGGEWLVINGVAVNVLRGVCLNCGEEFHWSISERALARLIKRARGVEINIEPDEKIS